MDARPKVALLVETSLGYGRGLLRGIVRYARLHGPWAFYLIPGDLRQALPTMERWGGDRDHRTDRNPAGGAGHPGHALAGDRPRLVAPAVGPRQRG